VVEIRRHRKDAQQRWDVEAVPLAVRVVVFAQRVLRRLRGGPYQSRGGFLLSADVVANRIALAGHAQIKGANVTQETGKVLDADRVADERAGTLGKNLRARGRRGEVLGADRPFATGVAGLAAGLQK